MLCSVLRIQWRNCFCFNLWGWFAVSQVTTKYVLSVGGWWHFPHRNSWNKDWEICRNYGVNWMCVCWVCVLKNPGYSFASTLSDLSCHVFFVFPPVIPVVILPWVAIRRKIVKLQQAMSMSACWTHQKVCGMCITLSSTQFAACGWVLESLGWSCMTARDSSCGRATGRCKNWVWRWARSAGWRRPWPPTKWRSTETECWGEKKKKKNQWAIALVPQFCPHWWLFVYIPGEEEQESKQPLDCKPLCCWD